jgi:peptide/nickel transport system permease protein
MRYLVRRVVFYLIAGWAAITMNFLIPRLMPGNPVQILLARFQGRLSPQAASALTALFGLNHASMLSQYGAYWAHLARGNLGISFTFFPTPVTQVISSSLPWTAVLIGVSTVLSFAIGTLLGIVTGWRRGSWLDNLLPIMTFFSSVPYFWLGLVAVYFLAAHLHWFPLSGGYSQSTSIGFSGVFLGSAVYHALLPAFTIVVSSVAGWLLGMRNMMVTTMSQDYVVMAEAKGLSTRRVMFTYAARNAVLPSIASFAMSLGFVVSGAILVEIVFSYPGIGYVLFQAVTNEDYPLMQGIFLVITLVVLAANFAADLAYVALDPRTRQEA